MKPASLMSAQIRCRIWLAATQKLILNVSTCVFINTLTIYSCACACRRRKLRSLLIASMRVSLMSIEAWLKASRLRLNPSKTQVMWLGSGQQLAKVHVDEVPVLTSQVSIVDTARNINCGHSRDACLTMPSKHLHSIAVD
jgi:hypothetical protein